MLLLRAGETGLMSGGVLVFAVLMLANYSCTSKSSRITASMARLMLGSCQT